MKLRRWLQAKAYPPYDCEQCVGQEWGQGCWCEYHGASAPGQGPTRWHLAWRWLDAHLFPTQPHSVDLAEVNPE